MWSEKWCAAFSAAGNAAITEVLHPVSSPQRTLIAPTPLQQATFALTGLFLQLDKGSLLGLVLCAGLCRSLQLACGNSEVGL